MLDLKLSHTSSPQMVFSSLQLHSHGLPGSLEGTLGIGSRVTRETGSQGELSVQGSKFNAGLQIYIGKARQLPPKAENRSAELVLLALQEAGGWWQLVSLENNGLHLGESSSP